MSVLVAVAAAVLSATAGPALAGTGHITVTRAQLAGPSATGIGHVVDDQGQIDCGSTCTGDYPWTCTTGIGSTCDFTAVTLTASSLNGWQFSSWDGCDSSSGADCNIEAASGSRSVIAYFRDVQDPTVQLNTPPPAGTHIRTSVSLSATASDNHAVASLTWWYQPQGGAKVSSTPGSLTSHSFDTSGLAEGPYLFGVDAKDYANRVSSATTSLFVDHHVAAPALGGSPADGSWTATPSATVSWSGLDADVTSVQCKIGSGSLSSCSSPWSPTLSAGANVLTVEVADGAGNHNSSSRTINYDGTAPTAGITGSTPTNAPSFALALDGTGSAAAATCWVDAAATHDSCSGTYVPTGLADGGHTLHVHVVDQAGNAADATRAFTVDTAAPALDVISGPADGAAWNTSAATYGFNAEGGAVLACSVDGSSYRACSGTAQDALGGLADGAHTWRVKATDAAGNTTVRTRSLTVDTGAPALDVTGGPPDGSVLTSASTTFGFVAESGTTLACALDSDVAFRPCSTATTDVVGGLADGPHTWRVRAIDGAGNVTTTGRGFSVQLPVAPVGAGGSPGAAPPGAAGVTAPKAISAVFSHRWTVRNRRTSTRTLKLSKLPAGAKVTVRCSGAGRPFATRTVTATAAGVADLRKLFAKALRSGVAVTITITKPGYAGEVLRFKTGRAAPKPTTSRLAP